MKRTFTIARAVGAAAALTLILGAAGCHSGAYYAGGYGYSKSSCDDGPRSVEKHHHHHHPKPRRPKRCRW